MFEGGGGEKVRAYWCVTIFVLSLFSFSFPTKFVPWFSLLLTKLNKILHLADSIWLIWQIIRLIKLQVCSFSVLFVCLLMPSRFLFAFLNNWCCSTCLITPCYLHCFICCHTDSNPIQFRYRKDNMFVSFLLSANHCLSAGIALIKTQTKVLAWIAK